MITVFLVKGFSQKYYKVQILCIPLILLPLWILRNFNGSGPYRGLTEFQMKLFGSAGTNSLILRSENPNKEEIFKCFEQGCWILLFTLLPFSKKRSFFSLFESFLFTGPQGPIISSNITKCFVYIMFEKDVFNQRYQQAKI